MYLGPVRDVGDYFSAIGFVCPPFMDIADFIQVVSTDDSAALYNPSESQRKLRPNAPTPDELAQIFRESEHGKIIQESLDKPSQFVWTKSESTNGEVVPAVADSTQVKSRYQNNFFASTRLIFKRFIILWLRDRRVIMAGAVKNIIMGVSVGGIYWNTMDPISIEGALFQAGLFIMLGMYAVCNGLVGSLEMLDVLLTLVYALPPLCLSGSMQTAGSLIEDRVTLYKHSSANFYSAWPFVAGRSLAKLPQV